MKNTLKECRGVYIEFRAIQFSSKPMDMSQDGPSNCLIEGNSMLKSIYRSGVTISISQHRLRRSGVAATRTPARPDHRKPLVFFFSKSDYGMLWVTSTTYCTLLYSVTYPCLSHVHVSSQRNEPGKSLSEGGSTREEPALVTSMGSSSGFHLCISKAQV